MTPAARIAASIELLEGILASWKGPTRIAADRLIDSYFKARRFIGSKDRGAVSELVYDTLRRLGTLAWWIHYTQGDEAGLFGEAPLPPARPLIIAALCLRKDNTAPIIVGLFNGEQYAPAPLTPDELKIMRTLCFPPEHSHEKMPLSARLSFPQWIEKEMRESLGARFEEEMKALNQQASVDLRVNTLRTTRERLQERLKNDGIPSECTRLSPVGLRLTRREPVFASPAFKDGWFEMQDEGSQVVALLTDAEPGMRVVDFCAGAGGKTLAIAASMHNKGKIIALDNSGKRLAQLPPRLRRAGVDNVEWRVISSESDQWIKRHKQTADRVLVDAPCSGTGTWRRNPDLKWRFTEKDLGELMEMQQRILLSASRLVKPGGRLVYATCSLLSCENEKQIETFLKTSNHFKVVCAEKIWNKDSITEVGGKPSYLWLTPHQDGVDGFFAAVLEYTA